jgi:hypothetical protein
MPFTPGVDFEQDEIATHEKLNAQIGQGGSIDTLKDMVDGITSDVADLQAGIETPLKVILDGGAAEEGVSIIEFDADDNIVLAKTRVGDTLKISIAASGGFTPTQIQSLPAPGYVQFVLGNPCNWTELFALTSFDTMFFLFTCFPGQMTEIGTGEAGAQSLLLPMFLGTGPVLIPFKIPAGTHLWARNYTGSSGSGMFAMSLFG